MLTFRPFVAGLSTEARTLLRSATAGGALEVAAVQAVDLRTRSVLIEHGLIVCSDALGVRAWRLTTFGDIVRGELEAADHPARLLARAVLYATDASAVLRDRADRFEEDTDELREAVDGPRFALAELVRKLDDGEV